MKDKLIELLSSCPTDPEGNRNVAVIAQHLLDNGVVVFDNDVVSPENRPLIQTVAGMPVNEVIDLVKAKQEGRIIVPPCNVVEVRHGEWIITEEVSEIIRECSCCHCKTYYPKSMRFNCRESPYCEDCGADMRGERRKEDG